MPCAGGKLDLCMSTWQITSCTPAAVLVIWCRTGGRSKGADQTHPRRTTVKTRDISGCDAVFFQWCSFPSFDLRMQRPQIPADTVQLLVSDKKPEPVDCRDDWNLMIPDVFQSGCSSRKKKKKKPLKLFIHVTVAQKGVRIGEGGTKGASQMFGFLLWHIIYHHSFLTMSCKVMSGGNKQACWNRPGLPVSPLQTVGADVCICFSLRFSLCGANR